MSRLYRAYLLSQLTSDKQVVVLFFGWWYAFLELFVSLRSHSSTYKTYPRKITMCCVFKWASYLAPNVQSLCVVALHNSSFSSYCYYCFKIIFVRSFVSHTYHKSTYILLCLTNKKILTTMWYMNPVSSEFLCAQFNLSESIYQIRSSSNIYFLPASKDLISHRIR